MRTGECKRIMAEEKKNQDDMNNEMSFEERQYKRLIDARNFHYENFNKWSLYFYAIIAALFVGYYHISNNLPVSLAIAILGYIVSICCYLSGKGYHYWEVSWIRLVQAYERRLNAKLSNDIEEKQDFVYSVFAGKEETNHPQKLLASSNVSSSKLLLLVSFSVASAWGYLLTTMACHALWGIVRKLMDITDSLKPCCKMLLEIIILLVAVGLTFCIVTKMAKTDKIKSRMNNLDEASEIPGLKTYLK